MRSRGWAKENKEQHCKNQRESMGRRLSAGKCQYCKNNRLEGLRSCKNHWFSDLSKARFGTTKYRLQLMELADAQDYKCAYTGEILTPGKNMSLDHKFPCSRFPILAKDMSNIQFVTKQINRMKTDMTHDEFLFMCQMVVNPKVTPVDSKALACRAASETVEVEAGISACTEMYM